MKSLRIVFTGFFGAGNLGDETILLAEVRGFKQRNPGSTCSVASFNPDFHRALGLEAFDARDNDALGKAVSHADLLVVGGGGLWQDYWGWNPGNLFVAEPFDIAFYARGLLTAAAIGVPSVLFANGVGPLRDLAARRAVASLASLATGVSVRDSESAALLRAGGFAGPIILTADPAFAIAPVIQNAKPDHPRVRIGIVPRIWTHGANPADLLRAIGGGVTRLARDHDTEVVLVRFQRPSGVTTEDDGTAIEQLTESMLLDGGEIRIVDPVTPEEAAGFLASCDAVVTMRLHGAILSAVAGVPSVAVGVDPKLVSNAQRLGLSELVVPLHSCSAADVESALRKALGKKEAFRAAMDAGIRAARTALEAAFDNALGCISTTPTAARMGPRGSRRTHRLSPVRREARPVAIALCLPDSTEDAQQTARTAFDWYPSAVIATGNARVCEALQNDQSVAGMVFIQSSGDSFGDFLQAAAQTIADVAPASADVIVLDATRFDPQAVLDALNSTRDEYPEAVVIAAPGSGDVDAAVTGAVQPNLGASWIRRDVWDEAIPHLTGLETPSGCGAEIARRARRRMEVVVAAPLSAAPQQDSFAIEQDLARAESLTPAYNVYFVPRPAAPRSKMITDWIAGRDVVVFPPTVGWTVSLEQRTNHMARALAEAGHAVLYSVERAPADEGPPKEVAPGVLTVSEPFSSLAFLEDPIVILYSYNVECASFFRNPRTVYEWIDDLSIFLGEPPLLEAAHRVALKRAKVVTATSAALWREAAAERPDALYLPNAVRVADFDPEVAPEMPLPAEDAAWLEADKRPVMIYWGAVAPWFDDHLLAQVAQCRPDLRFAIIGPGYEQDLSKLQSAALENLRYFGARPYGLLAAYARRSSAALVPFRPGKVTRAASPLKLFEYLAARLPVVSTPIPESAVFERVLLANEVESFSNALDEALALRDDPSYIHWIKQTIAAHDWSTRAAAIRAALGITTAKAPPPLPIPADLDERVGSDGQSTAPSMKRDQATAQLLDAQLTQHEQAGQTLRFRLSEQERKSQALVDQFAENEQRVNLLSADVSALEANVADRDKGIAWLEEELTNSRKEIIAARDEGIALLQDNLAQSERRSKRLAAQMAEEFAAQLAEKEAELEKITNSIGWRVLSRYGRVKYRFLLPIYRALGLMKAQPKVNEAAEPQPHAAPMEDQ